MNDHTKPDPNILSGLRKALIGTLPLHDKAGKNPIEGMFPGNAAGKLLAKQALDASWIQEVKVRKSETKTAKSGKTTTSTKEISEWGLTHSGRKYLLEADSPKPILEALLPVIKKIGEPQAPPNPELFRAVIEKATATCMGTIREAFGDLQREVLRVLTPASDVPPVHPSTVLSALMTALQKVEPATVVVPVIKPDLIEYSGHDSKTLGNEILSFVEKSKESGQDRVPFNTLFTELKRSHPHLHVGAFHDALRALEADGRIKFGGWSKMIDDIPVPELALFISHKVMYHVHPAH